MEEQLKQVMELSHEAMLALEGSSVVYLNAKAREHFPELSQGGSAASLLPEHILFSEAEQFVASAAIREAAYTVSGCRMGALLLLSLLPAEHPAPGLLSDGLLVNMRSALFNMGLAARQAAAQEDALRPETLHYFALLQHNYRLLLRQVRSLSLALALEENTAFLRISRIDLVEFCRNLVGTVCGLDAEALPSLSFFTPLPSLYADVDAEKLELLVLNLLSNSFRACKRENTVHLRLAKQNGSAVISVDDDGEGIPPEILQNVFSRYATRLTPGHLSQPIGCGLGLSVAKGIAELHGGALVIESRPGIGTSVRVLLPLEQSKADVMEDHQTVWPYTETDVLLTELSPVLPAECYSCELPPDE